MFCYALCAVVVVCAGGDAEKRRFMREVGDMGLADDDDFVLILPDLTGLGMRQQGWCFKQIQKNDLLNMQLKCSTHIKVNNIDKVFIKKF